MNQEGFLLEEEQEDKRFYRLSLWWVEHRALLRQIGIGIFIAFDAVLLSFVVWTMLDSFAISYGAEQRAVAEMVAYGQSDLHAYTVANAAEDLQMGSASVFSTGDGQFDLVVFVRNKNDDWWAEVDYHFLTDSGESEYRSGFILPSEEKPFVELAFDSGSTLFDAEFVVDNVAWYRVDHHLISDYEVWSDDRLNIAIEDAAFTTEAGYEDEVYGRTSFYATNSTAFSYYEPRFFIMLMRGSSVVGINRTSVSEFESGEMIDVSVNWFGTLPSVTSVEIRPEINIFDLDSYKALAGETTRDTRTRVFDTRR